MRIIANSLPKSGTHLLLHLLELLEISRNNLHLGASLVQPSGINPYLRYRKKRRSWRKGLGGTGLKIDLDNPNLHIRSDWLAKRLRKIPDNSFVTAHIPYSPEIEEFLTEQGLHIMFIIRDPRDVAVSFINYVLGDSSQLFHGYFSSLPNNEERIKAVLKGGINESGYHLASLSKRLSNCTGWLQSHRTCNLRFERLIGPKGGGSMNEQMSEIDKTFDFLGLDVPTTKRNQLASNIFSPKARTFRKGVIGSWRDVFSQESKILFKQLCGEELIKLGYEKNNDW